MSKESFAKKLAAALAAGKGAPAAGDLEGSVFNLSELLGGSKDKRPTDDTPVPDSLRAGSLSILTDLARENVPLDNYVHAYAAAVAVHYQLHAAPVDQVNLHEHVVAMAQAIEAIAVVRFGTEAFDTALQAVMKTHTERANQVGTEAALDAGPAHFKAMSPKNRMN